MSRSPALLHALLRPRGLGGRRVARRRSGIAILVVIATLMVMTVVSTEVAYGARARNLVAAHQRDRVSAYWLARSGLNLYMLLLIANKELAKNDMLSGMAENLGIPIGDALWQMVPVLNTGLLRMIMGAGGDIEDVPEEELAEVQQTGRPPPEAAATDEEGDGGMFDDKHFLDFNGDFNAEVQDHESRINVNAFARETATTVMDSPTGQQLFALMSGEEDEQYFLERGIDRWEVIGNLKDWVDLDNVRSGGLGGYEDTLYNTEDPPYLCKNAPFDSLEEVRLVAGWEGEVFERYKEQLTVWGDPNGKVNITTADQAVIDSLVRACAQPRPMDAQLQQCNQTILSTTFGFPPRNANDFIRRYRDNCGIELQQECITNKASTSSQTFTITSTGLVGTSSVTITAVFDFSSGRSTGRLLHWRVD